MKLIERSTVIAHGSKAGNLDRDEVDSEMPKKAYDVYRLDKKQLHDKPWDYSGIFYSNSFKVNKPISLLSVGFYGPYYDQNATYQVELQVEGLPKWNENPSKIINNTKTSIRAENGKSIMYVGFNSPVSIQPHTWHTIKFQLDGPPTFRGTSNYLKEEDAYPAEGAEFEFFRGSQQMPCLKYSLL